jgi:hypothetical protein
MLVDRSLAQLSSERLPPAADGNRGKNPQPNTRQSSGCLVEESGTGLSELERSRTPQEDLWSQLTWAHWGSQGLKHQPKNMQGLDLDPLHILTDVQLGLHVCPLRTETRAVFDSVACLWIPIPLVGLPSQTSVGEDVLSPATT